jgi:HAD superfamily hydrolase (TIGR01509 family)
VVEFVGKLRGQVRMAVVSATWRENVEAVLDAAGLAGSFESIVSKEDGTSLKATPKAYQLALRRLRVSPRSAAALEDGPSGLEAARAAGVRAIAVGHRRPHGSWVADSPYIPGLEPVEEVLRQLGL